jgi:hypothetical protein
MAAESALPESEVFRHPKELQVEYSLQFATGSPPRVLRVLWSLREQESRGVCTSESTCFSGTTILASTTAMTETQHLVYAP